MNAKPLRPIAFAVLLLVAITTAAIAVPPSAAVADTGWLGEYYSNPWLMGPPALIRTDGNIDFDWGSGSPAPQVPPDNFSVRWTRTLDFSAGRYRFTTTTDDGVRLFLDGQLIIDQWHDQAATSYAAERDLGAGPHSLRMEYYEATGGAVARLGWTRTDAPPPPGLWRGEYFANRWLSGSPTMVRDDAAIDFDWGGGSPAPQIPPDNFSVRWTRTLDFSAGRYRFTTTTDDGVRLYVDGKLIIDQWRDQPATTYKAEIDLGAGPHSLRMEYYEAAGGAVARLSWTRVSQPPPPPPSNPWRGEYYTNPWLSGSPTLVRNDSAIDFNWGAGSPAPQIPPDNFSVRWTRTSDFGGGRYRFRTTTDDGVRLWVDGRLVLDRWYDMVATFTVYLDLSAGSHTVRMEYYEHVGNAQAHLSIDKAKDEKPVPVGNIITCAPPNYSWVRVYRLEGSNWVDTNPKGYGPIGSSGRMKLDGFLVDTARYGGAGHPYRVEVWTNGVRIRSVGNTAAGESEFRVRAWADNYTPWGCP